MTTPTLREAAGRAAADLLMPLGPLTKMTRAEQATAAVAIIERHFAEVHAQVAALREALRDVAIVKFKWKREPCVRCFACNQYWPLGNPEQHAPNCLAALETRP